MGVGTLRRLLCAANVASVGLLAAGVWGFAAHRAEMRKPLTMPDFFPTPRQRQAQRIEIGNTAMPLGTWRDPRREREAPPPKPEKPNPQVLGTVRAAVVASPPYDGIRTAVLLRTAEGVDRLLRVGDAIETRPHRNPARRLWGDVENVRYEFVGCEGERFFFDVECDGETVVHVDWKREATPPRRPAGDSRPARMLIRKLSADGEPVPISIERPPGRRRLPLWDEPDTGDRTVRRLSRQGREFLRRRHAELVRGLAATPVPAGIKVRRIGRHPAAGTFGVQEGDVLVSINGERVRSRAQAIRVVREAVDAGAEAIEVEILRLGKSRRLRYEVRQR